MSRLTIRPTATKPYSAALTTAPMSPIATEADVSNAVGTLAGYTPPVVVDSTATDVPGIVADFNSLLADLRTAGIIA